MRMIYFCTAEERRNSGTACYFEFQIGLHRGDMGEHWLESSIYLYDEVFEELGLYSVFATATPQFDYYGITVVTSEQWQRVKSIAQVVKGEILVAINELDEWVAKCFESEKVFTICGI